MIMLRKGSLFARSCCTNAKAAFLRLALTRVIAYLVGSGLGLASAQTITNPRIVEFDPSADHSVTLPGGQPAVERYDFEIYIVGATAPFHTVNLGKPAPEADGKIRYDFSSQIASWPLPGGTYESRVAAVGPTGVGRSDVSNPFTFSAPCTYTLSSTAISVGASGGAQSVTVTAPAGCTWTASTTTSWISLTTTSGSGNGTVNFTVAANTTTASRTGTVTIAGQTLTITQAGVTCTYTLSPTSQSFPKQGGTGTVSVTSPAGCSWTATASASWVTVSAGASGSGTGTVQFSVARNDSALARTATLMIGGQIFTIDQAPGAPGKPRNVRVTSSGGE